MKHILLLALCALLSLNADARTLYVDAKRPNNKGNGLSVKKAKKTLQAAINIAKKGDTILVYPGSYAPIETKNKKIAIKSVKGQKKTKLVVSKTSDWIDLADLSKHVKKHNSQYNYDYTESTGNATMLYGFLFNGKGASFGVTGGTVNFCAFKSFWALNLAYKSNLFDCVIAGNYIVTTGFICECKVSRTKITDNPYSFDPTSNPDVPLYTPSNIALGTTLSNCLIAKNGSSDAFFDDCTLVNCTIADNDLESFHVEQFSGRNRPVAEKSKFYNCILWNNYGQIESTGPKTLRNADGGNTYKNTDKTNKDPKFANAAKGDYKLKKGSYCINKGKLTKAQKKLVGTKDLAGRKRIKGKAIDRGCYEY